MVNPQQTEPHIRVTHSTRDVIVRRDIIRTRKKGTVVPNEGEDYRGRNETEANQNTRDWQENHVVVARYRIWSGQMVLWNVSSLSGRS
jgi:hypothetical protein